MPQKKKPLANLSKERLDEITNYMNGVFGNPFSTPSKKNLSPVARKAVEEMERSGFFDRGRSEVMDLQRIENAIIDQRRMKQGPVEAPPSTHPSMAKYEPNKGISQGGDQGESPKGFQSHQIGDQQGSSRNAEEGLGPSWQDAMNKFDQKYPQWSGLHENRDPRFTMEKKPDHVYHPMRQIFKSFLWTEVDGKPVGEQDLTDLFDFYDRLIESGITPETFGAWRYNLLAGGEPTDIEREFASRQADLMEYKANRNETPSDYGDLLLIENEIKSSGPITMQFVSLDNQQRSLLEETALQFLEERFGSREQVDDLATRKIRADRANLAGVERRWRESSVARYIGAVGKQMNFLNPMRFIPGFDSAQDMVWGTEEEAGMVPSVPGYMVNIPGSMVQSAQVVTQSKDHTALGKFMAMVNIALDAADIAGLPALLKKMVLNSRVAGKIATNMSTDPKLVNQIAQPDDVIPNAARGNTKPSATYADTGWNSDELVERLDLEPELAQAARDAEAAGIDRQLQELAQGLDEDQADTAVNHIVQMAEMLQENTPYQVWDDMARELERGGDPLNMDVSAASKNIFLPEPGFPNGRLNLKYVGTGQNAKSWGYGIYLAENYDTSGSYFNSWTRDWKRRNPDKGISKFFDSVANQFMLISQKNGGYRNTAMFDEFQNLLSELGATKAKPYEVIVGMLEDRITWGERGSLRFLEADAKKNNWTDDTPLVLSNIVAGGKAWKRAGDPTGEGVMTYGEVRRLMKAELDAAEKNASDLKNWMLDNRNEIEKLRGEFDEGDGIPISHYKFHMPDEIKDNLINHHELLRNQPEHIQKGLYDSIDALGLDAVAMRGGLPRHSDPYGVRALTSEMLEYIGDSGVWLDDLSDVARGQADSMGIEYLYSLSEMLKSVTRDNLTNAFNEALTQLKYGATKEAWFRTTVRDEFIKNQRTTYQNLKNSQWADDYPELYADIEARMVDAMADGMESWDQLVGVPRTPKDSSTREILQDMDGKQIYDAVFDQANAEPLTGGRPLGREWSKRLADELDKRGVRGWRLLDQGSRPDTGWTDNKTEIFVLHNQDDLDKVVTLERNAEILKGVLPPGMRDEALGRHTIDDINKQEVADLDTQISQSTLDESPVSQYLKDNPPKSGESGGSPAMPWDDYTTQPDADAHGTFLSEGYTPQRSMVDEMVPFDPEDMPPPQAIDPIEGVMLHPSETLKWMFNHHDREMAKVALAIDNNNAAFLEGVFGMDQASAARAIVGGTDRTTPYRAALYKFAREFTLNVATDKILHRENLGMKELVAYMHSTAEAPWKQPTDHHSPIDLDLMRQMRDDSALRNLLTDLWEDNMYKRWNPMEHGEDLGELTGTYRNDIDFSLEEALSRVDMDMRDFVEIVSEAVYDAEGISGGYRYNGPLPHKPAKGLDDAPMNLEEWPEL